MARVAQRAFISAGNACLGQAFGHFERARAAPVAVGGQAARQGGFFCRIKAQADDVDGVAGEADGNFYAGEVAHAAGAGGGAGARLAADGVVIGQRPQLHAIGGSAPGHFFRLQRAVGGGGVAVQVGVQFWRQGRQAARGGKRAGGLGAHGRAF